MSKDQIQFAHANGFPSRTYTSLFARLEDRYDIGWIDRHGHDPAYPVTDNWDSLWKELADHIARRHKEPVIGIGHSLGGVLHLLASFHRPELYKTLILLDAPIISRVSSLGIKFLKITNLLYRYSPARSTRERRNRFASRAEAFRYFRSNDIFDRFDERVLKDYVRFGLDGEDGNLKLSFEPEIEARIYATLPDNLPSFKGRLKVPTFYLGGASSLEARMARLGFMKRNFDIEFRTIEGSHLFPLERPGETAAMIRSFLDDASSHIRG